jgi:hypothetical protein
MSFSFPKGTRCPAGEEEYARANTTRWQYATFRMFFEMPKIDKSSRILLLSCLISGSGAGVLSLLNSRCLPTTLGANRMIHSVKVFCNSPNRRKPCHMAGLQSFGRSMFRSKPRLQPENRLTVSACSRCPSDRQGDLTRHVRVFYP